MMQVSPHPDDETLGCGMALASAAATGRRSALRGEELQSAPDTLTPGQGIAIARAGPTEGSSAAKRPSRSSSTMPARARERRTRAPLMRRPGSGFDRPFRGKESGPVAEPIS